MKMTVTLGDVPLAGMKFSIARQGRCSVYVRGEPAPCGEVERFWLTGSTLRAQLIISDREVQRRARLGEFRGVSFAPALNRVELERNRPAKAGFTVERAR